MKLAGRGRLKCSLSFCSGLSCQLTGAAGLSAKLSAERGVAAAMSRGGPPLPWYEGTLLVVPDCWDSQTLPTKGRSLKGDVEVTEVPLYETSNEGGGWTAVIGS